MLRKRFKELPFVCCPDTRGPDVSPSQTAWSRLTPLNQSIRTRRLTVSEKFEKVLERCVGAAKTGLVQSTNATTPVRMNLDAPAFGRSAWLGEQLWPAV